MYILVWCCGVVVVMAGTHWERGRCGAFRGLGVETRVNTE